MKLSDTEKMEFLGERKIDLSPERRAYEDKLLEEGRIVSFLQAKQMGLDLRDPLLQYAHHYAGIILPEKS